MEEIRIAIDVESGDFGPDVLISGLRTARKLCTRSFKALLCGNRETVERFLSKSEDESELGNIEIIHCSDTISPHDKRAIVWKQRTDSSTIRCIALQKEGRADASVSAGDTAILMGAAIFILGRSEGVLRPALAAFLPTVKKKTVLLLDVGANLNCRAEHLVSFAYLGHRYFSRYFERSAPVISLLNIGKESMKGTNAVCEAAPVLQKKFKEYMGFIEGGGVVTGDADIVVCDGFIGNVLLKAFEQFHVLVESVIGTNADLIKQLKSKMASLDPEQYGAVPLLGIKGTVFKAHGGSSPRAIAHAICTAVTAVERNATF